MTYETRILKISILPKGEPIFSEHATEIEIVDNAAGEYLKITQNTDEPPDPESGNQTLCIDPSEWPSIKAGIEKMLKECRNHNEQPQNYANRNPNPRNLPANSRRSHLSP